MFKITVKTPDLENIQLKFFLTWLSLAQKRGSYIYEPFTWVEDCINFSVGFLWPLVFNGIRYFHDLCQFFSSFLPTYSVHVGNIMKFKFCAKLIPAIKIFSVQRIYNIFHNNVISQCNVLDINKNTFSYNHNQRAIMLHRKKYITIGLHWFSFNPYRCLL